jgi:hypothetical protein
MSVAEYCDWTYQRELALQEFTRRWIRPAMERFIEMSAEEQQQALRESGLKLTWTHKPPPLWKQIQRERQAALR